MSELNLAKAGAMDLLVASRTLGLAWFTPDGIVHETLGELSAFVTIGAPVAASIPALVGMDDILKSVREGREPVLAIPNVTMDTGEEGRVRLTLRVLWDGEAGRYLIALARSAFADHLELELAQQVRARRLVEAELVEKTKEIEAANRELARANRDLEEFAYVISHDLKAPLRAMRYLLSDVRHGLDAQCPTLIPAHLDRLEQQAVRMSSMLTGLFEYARIGREAYASGQVETLKLVEDVVSSLGRERGLSISIFGEWPTIETPEAALDLVLRNLVDNALKYHDREVGEIRIEARKVGQDLEISVADDGPGIEKSFHVAIFQPFVRLNSDLVAEATGVGLALVHRTVEAVGGQISIISDPVARRGATFLVRWPMRLHR